MAAATRGQVSGWVRRLAGRQQRAARCAPAAAYVSGLLAGKASASALRLFGALSAGMLIIYVGGTAQLAFLTQLDLQTVMTLSVLPFLGGDLTKVLIGVFVAKKVRPTSLARL